MKTMRALLLILLLCALPVQAQLWSSVLVADRGIDWSSAGATIIDRSSVCQSISAYNGSTSTINTAMTNCSSGGGGVVSLGAGTFNLTSGALCMASNVTLRGQGELSTKLVMSGSGACSASFSGAVVFAGESFYAPSPINTANWTAGYTKGTTVITVSSTTNLAVGRIMLLDQLDDTGSRVDGIFNCSTSGSCSVEGPGATWFRAANRNQVQAVRVTNIAGSSITIDPPLHMPNWRSGQSPGAYWVSGAPISGAGLEQLTIDYGASSTDQAIIFEDAYNNWIKNTRIINAVVADRFCLLCLNYASVKNTLRDSYIFGVKTNGGSATQNYGVQFRAATSNLIENTIWHQVMFPWIQGPAGSGNVFGYNYDWSNWYTPGSGSWPSGCGVTINCAWMQPGERWHAAANNYTLFEGNDTNGVATDALHGPSFFGTMVRNALAGWELEGGASNGTGKTDQTDAAAVHALNRYFGFLGNVLGTSGKHSTYQCSNATTTDDCAAHNSAIFVLGYSGNGAYTSPISNDAQIKATLYRWGNYDIVTGANRWCGNSGSTGWSSTCSSTSEVPTAAVDYPQTVPASEAVPNSFYLSSKPSWYGAVTWPSIGPDVSGVTGPGNKIIKIPARVCFEAASVDSAYSSQGALAFDSTTCYAAGAAPSAPTRLRLIGRR